MENEQNRQDKALTYLLAAFSLILHAAFILLIISIPPSKKVTIEKKLFNLVEMKYAAQKTQDAPQVQETMKPPLKTASPAKSLKSETSVEPQTSVEKTEVSSANPEIITSEGPAAQNAPAIVQGVPHGGIKSDTSASIVSAQTANAAPVNNASESPAIETIDANAAGVKPVRIYGPEPAYPIIAQDLGITGTVKAILTIDEKGIVTEVTIESSPHKSMSDEVKRTLLMWKFKPVKYKGSQVIVKRFIQEIEYKSEQD